MKTHTQGVAKRLIFSLFFIALLGGCAVVPYGGYQNYSGYGYQDNYYGSGYSNGPVYVAPPLGIGIGIYSGSGYRHGYTGGHRGGGRGRFHGGYGR